MSKFPDNADSLLKGHPVRCDSTTPIAESIRWGREKICQIFLDLDLLSESSQPQEIGEAIIAASEVGDLEKVRYFIKLAKTSSISSTKYSFLWRASLAITLATIGSHEQIVIELLQAGTMPDSESIIAAILVRNIKLLRLFLDIGVPLAERANGRGFLSLAVRWGNLDAVQLLIEAGASLHEMGFSIPFLQIDPRTHRPLFTPLGEAVNRGDEKLIQLLFENGASASLERMATSGLMESPLCTAVKSRNESIVQMLLLQGAEPCDSLALLAASSQSTVMMQILLQAFHSQYPAGKKYYSSFALRAAIRNCDLVKLRLLARYTDLNDTEQKSGDMDVSENPYEENLPSPLGEAIATCNVEIIQIILDAGGNPNKTVTTRTSYRHRGRWTALLAAVATEDLKIVELICNAGADMNYAAHLGTTRTPLQLAVETGSLDIVKFLLSRDADVNALPCIWGGGTALQLAAIKGYVGIAELLIQRGANINAPRGRYEGRTAFEGAAERGRMDMLLLLYHKGVDLVSDGGEQVRRAMELAEENSQLGAKGLVEQLSLSPGATFMI